MVAVNTRKRPVSDGCHSTSPSIQDEGELMSDEASASWSGGSSEEGEIQSEIEEADASPGSKSIKEETPWERGLRLARERVEKAKVVRAAEKDLIEKRMTLPVIEPAVSPVVENEEAFIEDMFWPCYYQPSIVGHTELTSRRYLPEDLSAPTKGQTLAWRRSLRASDRRRTYRYSPLSSRSGSVSSHASSRYSRRRSSSAASFDSVSSIASIAESWKASCARALRDYLGSPTHGGSDGGGKARRSARYGGGGRRRDNRGRSSSSGNSSSSRRSASSQSSSRRQRRRYIYTGGIARVRPSGGASGRTGISPSSSRSSSGSARDGGGGRFWRANRGGLRLEKDRRRQGSERGSESPESAVRPVPLPHERPVKRPWVADPSLASMGNIGTHTLRTTPRDGSSRSRSGSPLAGDEKQYITSWSRSPSSENERRPAWHRRERLPDVIPGGYAERVRRGVTPSRRRTSRSPFADGDPVTAPVAQRHLPTGSETTSGGPRLIPGAVPGKPTELDVRLGPAGAGRAGGADAQSGKTGLAQPSAAAAVGGALPSASSRPGVRMTLAPRLKSSGLAAASLTGAASRATATNRQVFAASPPPVTRQLPPPSAASPTSLETPKQPLSPTQIRMQAEAVAAIVEAREKRRAAAEAARRQRNPNHRQHRKHPDLSDIPLRGRPTYRRMSFSSQSSYEDSSRSPSASGASSPATSRSGGSQRADNDTAGRQKMAQPASKPAVQAEYGGQSERGPRHSKKAAWAAGATGLPQLQRKRHGRASYQLDTDGYGGQLGSSSGPVAYEQQQASGGDLLMHSYGGRSGVAPGARLLGMPGEQQQQRYRKYNSRQGGDHRFSGGYEQPGPQYHHHKSMPEAMRSYDAAMGYFDADDDLAELTSQHHKHHDDYRMRGSRQQLDISTRYPGAGSGRYDGRRARGIGFPRGYHQLEQQPVPYPRTARPGTPHATLGDSYPPYIGANRSPHAGYSVPGPTQSRHPRGKARPELSDSLLMPVDRKRVHIDAMMEDYEAAGGAVVDVKRARSRHRSRGPGAPPIDRSEPFESDAGNTYAAEQRLRQLRERLNFVDDAIAEIKASGASVGYSSSRK